MYEQVKQEDCRPARDERGRLLPGHTANPHGRPKHSQDRYNKKTLKALSRFVDNPERMQAMLQECWKEDKLKTMAMILGARTKDVSIGVDRLKIVEMDWCGFDEHAIDCELMADAELVDDEPLVLPHDQHRRVTHCIE